MKMPALFAAAAGLTLLGASPPPMMYGPPGAGAPGGYPPCSASLRDRCIQLYERGVASPRNLAMNERLGPERMPRRFAHMGRMRGPMPPMGGEMGPPREIVVASNEYHHCRGPMDDRCIQAPAPTAAPRSWRHEEREMVRIGERG